MNTIGQNIKQYREQKGFTQEELALKVRVGGKTIARYESGEQTPNPQTIMKLSTVLDVPASVLMGQQNGVATPPEADPAPSGL
jgi:transcriptional regulator with XRE-family HTH domain